MSADERQQRDALVLAMAREIVDGDLVGVGLGTPLAVLAALVARRSHAPDAHVLVGGAVDPDADLATCLRGPEALLGRTAGFVPHLDTMHQAERQTMTLQFLRPAQVDGSGACNVSGIRPADRPAIRLPGGLATADVPLLLPRLVVHLPTHQRRSLPASVDVATGRGRWAGPLHPTRGVVAIMTDLGVFEVRDGRAVLTRLHPGVDLEDVVERTGFPFDAADAVTPEPARPDEQRALDELDAGGLRYTAR